MHIFEFATEGNFYTDTVEAMKHIMNDRLTENMKHELSDRAQKGCEGWKFSVKDF